LTRRCDGKVALVTGSSCVPGPVLTNMCATAESILAKVARGRIALEKVS
jgi:hypothetical protein